MFSVKNLHFSENSIFKVDTAFCGLQNPGGTTMYSHVYLNAFNTVRLDRVLSYESEEVSL